MRWVLMFAGQGSQYYGMGRALMRQEPSFAATVRQGSDYLHSLIERDLIAECMAIPPSSTPLDDILLSHAGLVIIQVALARTLQAQGVVADAVWGNSVGEYAAAVTAGCYDFEDAIYLATQQALLLQQHCQPGALLAVLADRPTLDQCLPEYTLAAVHFNSHHVLSGTVADVQAWQATLEQQGITTERLPVHYGFHSAAIDPARATILATQRERALQPSNCAYHSSLLASECMDGPQSEAHFWAAIRQPIHFQARYQQLADHQTRFIDLSPTATLTTFCKYNTPAGQPLPCYPVLNPWAPKHNGIQAIKQHHTARGAA